MMKKFYQTETEFEELRAMLKLISCPHCKKIGYLILHGYLYGYQDTCDSSKTKRGRRIFCSNRKNRKGCGGTFSILKASILKRFRVSTRSLWCFLDNILNGMNTIRAFQASGSTLGEAGVYRLYSRFKHEQSRIRAILSGIKDPPLPGHSANPAFLTLMHLKTVFKGCPCPISEFQHHFQVPFFE